MQSKTQLVYLLIGFLFTLLPTSHLSARDTKAPVTPIFEGLSLDPQSGAYFAVFGYDNENDHLVEIPVGWDNKLGLWPLDLGQTTEFQPGRVHDAFKIRLSHLLPIVWSLKGPDHDYRFATAPPGLHVKKVKPIVENDGVVEEYDATKGVFIAYFGYDNPNPFPLEIPLGPKNKFAGRPQDLGQVTTFEPGRIENAFSIELQPGEKKLWKLIHKTVQVTAPVEIPKDDSIDPIGGGIPDPNDPESQVVDSGVKDIVTGFNNLDSTKQNWIEEAYFVESQRMPNGKKELIFVELEFQFSSLANKEQTYQILKQALGFTDQDSIANGMQLKLTLRLSPELAVQIQTDDDLALINPILVLGENNLIEIMEVRPRPFLNSGIVVSQADTAQGSNRARRGWGVTGKGAKIGLLSDSYNSLGGASAGIANGELPENVQVLKDNAGSDEGRAMAEIVHDVAPGAEQLLFHTAFKSEGDFALGIKALASAGSNIIVDDVTYPTAPWFTDGPVSRAISEVVNNGVVYLTSAGNFYDHAVEGTFSPATSIPAGLPFPNQLQLHAIDGEADVLQTVRLDSGLHIMTLQWDNDFVTEGTGGAVDDLDIYILNEDGSVRAGKNKSNLGNDPWEFFAFEVKATEDVAHIVIVRKGGSTANLKFKYVLFRTAGVEFTKTSSSDNLNASTIIAHAANPAAITVGAAPYFDTGKLEAFSSLGAGQKPDFTAADGGNTSFFGFDYEGDLIPNFFGTSAAAPHLAASLALLKEGYDSLALEAMTPVSARATLIQTAKDIGEPGFDNLSGYGFIRIDRALQTLGNPLPLINQLDLLDRSDSEPTFDLGINGDFFVEGQTLVRIGNDTIMPSSVTENKITIEVDTSIGSSPIQTINPPIANSGSDGGSSQVFTATDEFYTIDVSIADALKTYLQAIPVFETSFTVTPTVLAEGNALSAQDSSNVLALLADPKAFSSLASDTSSIGLYQIDFEPGELDTIEKVGFTSQPGLLVVEPLEIFLHAEDLSITEGDAILSQLEFSLDADFSGIEIVDKQEVLDALLAAYEGSLADALVVANFARAIVNNPDAEIDPALLSKANMLISLTALEEGRTEQPNGEITVEADSENLIALANDPDAVTAATNFARAIVNGNNLFDPDVEVFLDFDDDGIPETNLARAIVNFARAIVNGGEVGDSEILLNFARAIVNEEPLDEQSLRNFARAIVNETQNPDSDAISNFARAIVNEGLVDEPGSLLNLARAIVNEDNPGPEAFSNFARAIVNLARAIVNRGGRAIVNFRGRAIVNGKAFADDNPFYTMIAVSDTASLNGSGDPNDVEFFSIPMISGNGPGQHLILPGSIVLTNEVAMAMANGSEEISGLISIPIGNFVFTSESGILTVEENLPETGIQSFVWDDLNQNGLQDAGEPGIPGVKVQLVNKNAKKWLQTAYTDESGIALFEDIDRFDGIKVRLRFPELEGYERVQKDVGTDSNVDSDADMDGVTQPFFFDADLLFTNWDAGYQAILPAFENSVEIGLREEEGETQFNGEFEAFPNPTIHDLNILIPQGVEGKGDIRIIDISGKTLRVESMDFVPGSRVKLDFTTVRKGVYFIQVNWDQKRKLFKVLKN